MLETIDKEYRNTVTDNLEKAIDAEEATAKCFRYISAQVKNGKIRHKFVSFAGDSQKNKELLLKRLEQMGEKELALKDNCVFCKSSPQSFSLFGALNLGLEITDVSRKVYSRLLTEHENSEDEVLFRRLLGEKKQLRGFLKREKKFALARSQPDFLINFSIPHIAGRLAK